MRKPLPKECLESTIRSTTTSTAFHLKKIKDALFVIENVSDFSPINKTHIVIHHSLTKDSKTVSWNPIREYHMNKFNTYDIGYHFGIEEVRKSEVFEILIGRGIRERGIHCPQSNMNELGIGFMFCGNFDIAPPVGGMLEKASLFLADLCILTGIPPENIKGHRSFNNNKTCPGKLFNIEYLRELVTQKL